MAVMALFQSYFFLQIPCFLGEDGPWAGTSASYLHISSLKHKGFQANETSYSHLLWYNMPTATICFCP